MYLSISNIPLRPEISMEPLYDEAQARENTKRIVIFNKAVTLKEKGIYIMEMMDAGTVPAIVHHVPCINGIVLTVPRTITSEMMLEDYRIAHVEEANQRIRVQTLPALENDAWPAHETADIESSLAAASHFTRVDPPRQWHRPQGIVKLNSASYHPRACTSFFDERTDEPEVICHAISRIAEQELKIAVFDSGIDCGHSYLDGAIEGGTDFVNMNPWHQADHNGHGTHVAGLLCARCRDHKFGLLCGARIYGVKVLDRSGTGELSSLIMGIQWAIDNDIDIINLSAAYTRESPALRLAVQKAHEAGIIMIAPAGNRYFLDDTDGLDWDAGTWECDDTLISAPAMFPARYPEVISVGAMTPLGQVADFSIDGPEVDIYAPGVNVLSTVILDEFGVCSGTSMAVPHVTAAAAMLLAVNPSLNTERLKTIFTDTATNGELDIVRALKLLKRGASPAALNFELSRRNQELFNIAGWS